MSDRWAWAPAAGWGVSFLREFSCTWYALSTGTPAPVSDCPSLRLQPQTWGPMGLPRMTAEKPGNCWKEALAWVYLLPWIPGQKEVESLRSRAPRGPECRAEVRGMNLGLPEALHYSQTRVSLAYPLINPASWVGGVHLFLVFLYLFLFIWLHRVFVVTWKVDLSKTHSGCWIFFAPCLIFSCAMWNL